MDRFHWLQMEFEMQTMPAHPTSDLKVTAVRVLRMQSCFCGSSDALQTRNPSAQPSLAGSYSSNSLGEGC